MWIRGEVFHIYKESSYNFKFNFIIEQIQYILDNLDYGSAILTYTLSEIKNMVTKKLRYIDVHNIIHNS
jgi:hypothetical protein